MEYEESCPSAVSVKLNVGAVWATQAIDFALMYNEKTLRQRG